MRYREVHIGFKAARDRRGLSKGRLLWWGLAMLSAAVGVLLKFVF